MSDRDLIVAGFAQAIVANPKLTAIHGDELPFNLDSFGSREALLFKAIQFADQLDTKIQEEALENGDSEAD